VARYRGQYRVRSFSCWDQFLGMAFAHGSRDHDSEAPAKKEVPSSRKAPLLLQGVENRTIWASRQPACWRCAFCCKCSWKHRSAPG
jgi:hypothetical protein